MILGFCGAIQAGKSTCSNLLCDNYEGYKQYSFAGAYKQYSFAGALKQSCCEVNPDVPKAAFGWNGKNWNGPKTERGRKLLQEYGQAERDKNADVWLDKTVKQIEKDHPYLAIIEDARHVNELEYIKNNNGIVIYVSRESKEQEFLDDYLNINEIHPSECSWRLWLVRNQPYMSPLKLINPYTFLTMIDNNDNEQALKNQIAELDYQISRLKPLVNS